MFNACYKCNKDGDVDADDAESPLPQRTASGADLLHLFRPAMDENGTPIFTNPTPMRLTIVKKPLVHNGDGEIVAGGYGMAVGKTLLVISLHHSFVDGEDEGETGAAHDAGLQVSGSPPVLTVHFLRLPRLPCPASDITGELSDKVHTKIPSMNCLLLALVPSLRPARRAESRPVEAHCSARETAGGRQDCVRGFAGRRGGKSDKNIQPGPCVSCYAMLYMHVPYRAPLGCSRFRALTSVRPSLDVMTSELTSILGSRGDNAATVLNILRPSDSDITMLQRGVMLEDTPVRHAAAANVAAAEPAPARPPKRGGKLGCCAAKAL
eukprot:SAG11_NODE_2236_length_3652_cov_9.578666_1_plen_323_part_00